ncbi:UNVERIFIED_ORG: hypothetical protein BDK47_11665 [Anoxybacillus amylolyticus]
MEAFQLEAFELDKKVKRLLKELVSAPFDDQDPDHYMWRQTLFSYFYDVQSFAGFWLRYFSRSVVEEGVVRRNDWGYLILPSGRVLFKGTLFEVLETKEDSPQWVIGSLLDRERYIEERAGFDEPQPLCLEGKRVRLRSESLFEHNVFTKKWIQFQKDPFFFLDVEYHAKDGTIEMLRLQVSPLSKETVEQLSQCILSSNQADPLSWDLFKGMVRFQQKTEKGTFLYDVAFPWSEAKLMMLNDDRIDSEWWAFLHSSLVDTWLLEVFQQSMSFHDQR